MSEPEHPSGFSSPRYRYWLTAIGLVLGLFSAGFTLYDLWRPNHFVGDMYGMEVVARLVYWFPFVLVLVVAAAAMWLGYRKSGRITLAAVVLLTSAACVLFTMAIHTAYMRQVWAQRKTYPDKTVTELLRLARENKDQFAIEALGRKRNPAAVPGLRQIVLDSDEQGALRVCAARALCQIGTSEAREVLNEAAASNPPSYLRDAIKYALEDIEFYESMPQGQSLPRVN